MSEKFNIAKAYPHVEYCDYEGQRVTAAQLQAKRICAHWSEGVFDCRVYTYAQSERYCYEHRTQSYGNRRHRADMIAKEEQRPVEAENAKLGK